MPFLLVLAGSAAGGVARFAVSGLVARRYGETFPWGTLCVNASGACAIGLVAALLETGVVAATTAWPLLVIGFLGSYTTVSSFSLQTLALARDGGWREAGANIALSLLLCLGAVVLGYAAGRVLAGG